MTKPWSEIVQRYAKIPGRKFAPMERLARQIESSRYAQGLFPYTSMTILCIAQMPAEYPNVGPYLCISLVEDGTKLEFRYIDTHIVDKQWHRTVDSADGFDRLERFVLQLHWFTRQ
jgi:hypothetical protein